MRNPILTAMTAAFLIGSAATTDASAMVPSERMAVAGRDAVRVAPPLTQTPTRMRKVPNVAFTTGEELKFDLKYGFIKAGEATMSIPEHKIISGRDTYHVVFRAQSSRTFSKFFRVDDRYETFLDLEGIHPWRFEQHIREGGYRRDAEVTFDHARGVAIDGDKEYAIPPFVHDIVSAFYFVRTQDLSRMHDGEVIKLQNFFNGKVNPLDVRLVKRERIETPAGTFNALKIEPLVQEGGLFKSEGRLFLWLTDDERHIPIRVESKVVVGSIRAELTHMKGINGPIASAL